MIKGAKQSSMEKTPLNNLMKVKNISCSVNKQAITLCILSNNLHSAEGHRRKKKGKGISGSTITLLAMIMNKENSGDKQAADVNDVYCNLEMTWQNKSTGEAD